MFKRKMSIALALVMVLTALFSMPIIQANAAAIVATDATVVCADAPAGMNTLIEDNLSGFVTVSLILKGQMNINSFSWALKYDKTKVVPVTFGSKVDAPDSNIHSAATLATYFDSSSTSLLTNWTMSSYIIENSVVTDNYFLIGYARQFAASPLPSPSNSGSTISLANGNSATILKATFRKVATIDNNTFSYFFKETGGTVVSKLIYEETNIVSNGTEVAPLYVRSDLFTKSFGFNVTVGSSSAADYMDTGDVDLNLIVNSAWETKVRLKNTFLSDPFFTTTINPSTKSVTISGVLNGVYVMEVVRNGFLPRFITVTVDGANVDLGDKPILPGDLNYDGNINGQDSGLLFSVYNGVFPDAPYDLNYDLNADGNINGQDTGLLFASYNLDFTSYGEVVNLET